MPPLNDSMRIFPDSDGLNCYEVPTSLGFHFVRLTFVRYTAGMLHPVGMNPQTAIPPHPPLSSESRSPSGPAAPLESPPAAEGVSDSTSKNRDAIVNETERYSIFDIRDASFSVVIEGAPREVIHMSDQQQWRTVEYLVRVLDGAATICFFSVKGMPYVNTVEVLKPKFKKFGRTPWLPPLKTLWRINSGGGEIIPSWNSTGRGWLSDGVCSNLPANSQTPGPGPAVVRGQRAVPGAGKPGPRSSWTLWAQDQASKPSSYSPGLRKGNTRPTSRVVASVQIEEDLKALLPSGFLESVKRPTSGTAHLKYNFQLSPMGPSVRSFLVALYFVEQDRDVAMGQRLMDISINGEQCMHGFDMLSAANGSANMPVSVTCRVVLAMAPGREVSVLQVAIRRAGSSLYDPQVSGVEVYQMLPFYLARQDISLGKGRWRDAVSTAVLFLGAAASCVVTSLLACSSGSHVIRVSISSALSFTTDSLPSGFSFLLRKERHSRYFGDQSWQQQPSSHWHDSISPFV